MLGKQTKLSNSLSEEPSATEYGRSYIYSVLKVVSYLKCLRFTQLHRRGKRVLRQIPVFAIVLAAQLRPLSSGL